MPDELHLQYHTEASTGRQRMSRSAALAQLRAFIADRGFQPGDRLPAERPLCHELGLRRSELRRTLDTLEWEGVIWRHVGKGTFLSSVTSEVRLNDFARLSRQVSPVDVMRARSAIEPALARQAALNSSASAISRLRLNTERARGAATWREYEALDNDFHRLIAEASDSVTLMALFDQLNALRRMMSSERIIRTGVRPPSDHSSFSQHARIVEEIAARNPDGAQTAMSAHLWSVENRLFG
jgi:DNA-binding FadR family transcriptional regulator